MSFKALISFKNWSYNSKYRLQGYNTYQLTDYTKNEDGTYNYTVNSIGDATNHMLDSFFGTDGDRRFYFQGYFNYDRAFGDHHVGGMLLYNQDEYNSNVNSSLLNSCPNVEWVLPFVLLMIMPIAIYLSSMLVIMDLRISQKDIVSDSFLCQWLEYQSGEILGKPIRNIVSNFKIRMVLMVWWVTTKVPYTRLYMESIH